MNYLKNLLEKSFTYEGRETRKTYWITKFMIGFIIVLITFIGESIQVGSGETAGIIAWLIMIPGLISLSVRRLHDIGRSGWWLLIYFIPLIGILTLLVFFLTGSDRDNIYGKDPYNDEHVEV